MTVQDIPHATSRKRSGRMLAVLDLLETHEHVTLTDLVRALDVSPATVRRDLADLEEQGMLVRTHGGARAASRTEVPVRLRDSQFREAKQRIARRAAALIPPGPYSVAISGRDGAGSGGQVAAKSRRCARNARRRLVLSIISVRRCGGTTMGRLPRYPLTHGTSGRDHVRQTRICAGTTPMDEEIASGIMHGSHRAVPPTPI